LPKLPFTLPGFEIQQISQTEVALTITAQAMKPGAVCPRCQQISLHVHSYYTCIPQDLPVSGQRVHLILHVRRFRCPNRHCQQQTFVERLPDVVPLYARRTTRLGSTLNLFATALSRQAGARLLKPIGMAVSADTLVRIAKQVITRSAPTPTILGVDDFGATRKVA
jgi:transposase